MLVFVTTEATTQGFTDQSKDRQDSSESKGTRAVAHVRIAHSPCLPLDDDGIVVEVFCTYILRCADGALYIGTTEDLDSTIGADNAGEAALFTPRRRPVALVYAEAHPTRLAAVQRERQVKRWTRAKKEALICGDLALLKRL